MFWVINFMSLECWINSVWTLINICPCILLICLGTPYLSYFSYLSLYSHTALCPSLVASKSKRVTLSISKIGRVLRGTSNCNFAENQPSRKDGSCRIFQWRLPSVTTKNRYILSVRALNEIQRATKGLPASYTTLQGTTKQIDSRSLMGNGSLGSFCLAKRPNELEWFQGGSSVAWMDLWNLQRIRHDLLGIYEKKCDLNGPILMGFQLHDLDDLIAQQNRHLFYRKTLSYILSLLTVGRNHFQRWQKLSPLITVILPKILEILLRSFR